MTARERPIIFSAPMVRAILDGTKTQTRRVWKMPRGCEWYAEMGGEQAGWFVDPDCPWWLHVNECRCPYGRPGDRLWVREAWLTVDGESAFYRADYAPDAKGERDHGVSWRPAMFMPRWASRIELEVTDVRVELLQDINAEDAWREGVAYSPDVDPVQGYRELWEQLHGPGAWDANPWVWVVEFRRLP
ncbi:MAG: hypothetical protein ING91_19265 [Rhodocyclaceae bacterium]|nr:hypothetical protein [Rhodocyclaceae bacterium]MCA3116374.1 hypothetical protein [Rhodocyclaceae bacterium]MCA3128565.1 hypothetical protein [Rhodocyclaceae bacterium]